MSSLPTRSGCHHFSLDVIKDATNHFDKSKVIGQGGEATVYLADLYIGSEKARVAVKCLKPNSNEFEREIEAMANIQHLHLVSLLGYCEESDERILVYEYMEKGSLSIYVNMESNISLSWQERIKICLGAARGLQYLHSETEEFPKGIIHRDVKPENILLDEKWVAKVSDFGMFKLSGAGQRNSTMSTNLKGTSGYYAPEYLRHRRITRKIDIYAFGVVLFEVLCRKMPWDRGDKSYYGTDDEDLGLWAQENVDTRIKGEISEESLLAFTDIIGKSLQADPRKRPTMDTVVLNLELVLKRQEQEYEARKLRAMTEQSAGDDEQNFLKEADLEHFHQLIEEKDGGAAMNWIQMMDRSTTNMSFQAWHSDSEAGPSWYRFRTVYEDVTPKVVRDFFWDDEYRLEHWDESLENAETLEEYPITGTMVVKWVRKILSYGFREYIICRRIWESSGQSYYCVTKGMPDDHPSVPQSKKLRRVDSYYSSWRIRAVKSRFENGELTSCEVLFFHREDFGIPREAVKIGVQRAMWKEATNTNNGLRRYIKILQGLVCSSKSESNEEQKFLKEADLDEEYNFLKEADLDEEQNFMKKADLERLRQLVEEKDGGTAMNWIQMMDRSTTDMSFQAWHSDSEAGPSWYRFRTVYEDVTPKVVRDFFWDDEYRRDHWDESLHTSETLEEYPITGTMVVKWVRKIWSYGFREYIIGRRIWESGQSYYCVTKGMPDDHPTVPQSVELRRVDSYYSSWCIRAVKSRFGSGELTSCEVLFFHREDFGAPREAVKIGVQRAMWKEATNTTNGLRRYIKLLLGN